MAPENESVTASEPEKNVTTETRQQLDPVDPQLIKRIKTAMAVPSPEKDSYWEIENVREKNQKRKRFLFFFKRRSLSDDLIRELRKDAVQAPGNTLPRINRLRKKHPDNGQLVLFASICAYGNAINSGVKEGAFHSFKAAVKDAAIAIYNDQISLYSMEVFFKNYFAYLDRFRRFQVNVYEEMVQDQRLDSYRRDLLNAIQIAEQFYSEKDGIQKVINQLKKRIKSSMYTTNIDPMMIREAAHHIANGNLAEKGRLGTSSETIAFVHAIISTFARIPILFGVVDKILLLLPDHNKSFLLRKISISSIRNFVKFRTAAAEGDKETMSNIGKSIFRENTFAMVKLEGQSLYQPYETDPFFNIAHLAQLSHGSSNDSYYQELVKAAINAMEEVIERDMSKNNMFTETATKLARKLNIHRTAMPEEKANTETTDIEESVSD